MDGKPRFLGNGQIFWNNRKFVLDHIVKDTTRRRINGRIVEDDTVYLIKTYVVGTDIPCTFAAKRIITYKMPDELAIEMGLDQTIGNIIWIDVMEIAW